MSHQKQVNQYAERDASELDEAGVYYVRHVIAMTREKLHEKSDIAEELAFRDMRIDELTNQRDELLDAMKRIVSMENTETDEWDGVERVIPDMCEIGRISISIVEASHSPDAGKMVPDGWQLVPVEPTGEMYAAGLSAGIVHQKWGGSGYEFTDPDLVYEAMLAAAPKLGGEL